MSDDTPKVPPFPNNLREVREQQRAITRDGLSTLCQRLKDQDSALYTSVSLTTIRDLELGKIRPRTKTAASLARALEAEPSELFPLGIDDPNRNPKGNTNITAGRRIGGRPSKSK